jgi:hypothetical protein
MNTNRSHTALKFLNNQILIPIVGNLNVVGKADLLEYNFI